MFTIASETDNRAGRNSNCGNDAMQAKAQPRPGVLPDTRQSTVTALDGTKTLRQIHPKTKGERYIYLWSTWKSLFVVEKPIHTIVKGYFVRHSLLWAKPTTFLKSQKSLFTAGGCHIYWWPEAIHGLGPPYILVAGGHKTF